MCRALRDSPIKVLSCVQSGIESIEVNMASFPRKLERLFLGQNSINSDGCQELAKLLQVEDSSMEYLHLRNNQIDDDGVAFLVDALRKNTVLLYLYLDHNDDISQNGRLMLLKLVYDITSVKATLQSNHKLIHISLNTADLTENEFKLKSMIEMTDVINSLHNGNAEAAGKEKLIQQLHSSRRARLAELQGVNQSIYSEIDPPLLPEILSLIGHKYGQKELYFALKSSIAEVISLVNRKECLRQKLKHHVAIITEICAELQAIERAERGQ